MVAPIAPEGGWREWFTTHPHQRTKYPILRSRSVSAVYYDFQMDQAGNFRPMDSPEFDYVEMWYDPRARQIWGQMGLHKTWFIVSNSASETTWVNGVDALFDCLLKQEPEPKQPEPSGSGWDDFDWSI